MVNVLRRKLLLLFVLALTIGGVILSTPASGAPTISDQKANKAVKALVQPSLIRAEIVTYSGGEIGDYRVYRGTVRKMRGRQLTLSQRDGSVVRVRLSSATQIRIDNRRVVAKRVRPGMRATVMRNGNAAASWLYIAKRLPDKSRLKIKSLLSGGFLRAEVISWVDGELLDSRADTGIIESADDVSLTLQEADGATVPMQIDSATQVWVNNMSSIATDLTAGMNATTIGNGEGLVSQIWAQGKTSGGPNGKK